jgi:hypothetical protein
MLFLGREREKRREGGIESEGMGGEWSLASSFVFLFFQSDILGLRFP